VVGAGYRSLRRTRETPRVVAVTSSRLTKGAGSCNQASSPIPRSTEPNACSYPACRCHLHEMNLLITDVEYGSDCAIILNLMTDLLRTSLQSAGLRGCLHVNRMQGKLPLYASSGGVAAGPPGNNFLGARCRATEGYAPELKVLLRTGYEKLWSWKTCWVLEIDT
jgi:hypothetical protein